MTPIITLPEVEDESVYHRYQQFSGRTIPEWQISEALALLQSLGANLYVCNFAGAGMIESENNRALHGIVTSFPHCGEGWSPHFQYQPDHPTLNLQPTSTTTPTLDRNIPLRRFLRSLSAVEDLQTIMQTQQQQQHQQGTSDWFIIMNIMGCVVCVCFVGIVAGLFLGYLTLDVLDLQIIERASLDEEERMHASKILPIVREKHLILVTLLLLNALAYETLPLFLDNLVPSWLTVVLSVTLILVFGEIIPSGVFTGPRQMYLGYTMAPLMNFFLFIMYPLAKPLALVLDYITHDEEMEEGYHRGELAALIQIQHEQASARLRGKTVVAATSTLKKRKAYVRSKLRSHQQRMHSPHWMEIKQEMMERIRDRAEEMDDSASDAITPPALDQLHPPLHPLEVDVVEGALQMKTKVAMDVYTPLSQVYSLSETLEMDKMAMTQVYSRGFSRVPVYMPNPNDPNDHSLIKGFLITRQLMLVDWDHCREVSTLPLQRPQCVSPKMNLVDLLRLLQKGGYPMTFVCARPDLANKALKGLKCIPPEAGFMGLVTLQDILESILQDRIYDEMDIRDRDFAVLRLQKWAALKVQNFYRQKKRTRNSISSYSSIHATGSYPDETSSLLDHKIPRLVYS